MTDTDMIRAAIEPSAVITRLSSASNPSLPPLLPSSPAATSHAVTDTNMTGATIKPSAAITQAATSFKGGPPNSAAPGLHKPPPPPRFHIPPFACLRCFASDHLIKDCRDTVRCWRCGASGHMQSHCRSTSWPPCHATPWPTSRHPSRALPVLPTTFEFPALPFSLPPSTPLISSSSSSSPSTPSLTPQLRSNTVYHPHPS